MILTLINIALIIDMVAKVNSSHKNLQVFIVIKLRIIATKLDWKSYFSKGLVALKFDSPQYHVSFVVFDITYIFCLWKVYIIWFTIITD